MELTDANKFSILASKELVFQERITENSFHLSIDDPAIIEICEKISGEIEIPL